MMKMEANVPPYFEWIKDNIPKGSVLGVDESQLPAKSFITRRDFFKKHEITLTGAKNLVDEVWADNKPPIPQHKVWRLEDKFAGETTLEKFKKIGSKMEKDANLMLITALDDLAWILNLRGTDISFNPIFFCYGILHKDGDNYTFDLFIDEVKVSEHDIQDYLKSVNVTVYPYGGVEKRIAELGNKEE